MQAQLAQVCDSSVISTTDVISTHGCGSISRVPATHTSLDSKAAYSTPSIVHSYSAPRRQRRRCTAELESRELWHCPTFGCSKAYKRTSTISIKAHKQKCPTNYEGLQCHPVFSNAVSLHTSQAYNAHIATGHNQVRAYAHCPSAYIRTVPPPPAAALIVTNSAHPGTMAQPLQAAVSSAVYAIPIVSRHSLQAIRRQQMLAKQHIVPTRKPLISGTGTPATAATPARSTLWNNGKTASAANSHQC